LSEPPTETLASGIRHPDGSGRWLVPPWPTDAGVCELVQHFQRFQPALHASSAIQAAYYGRYAAVLAATPSTDLAGELSWRWFTELLGAVNCAATSAQAEHAATLEAAQASLQLSLVRTCGLNNKSIPGQAS
jgi:hypothetical protein